MAGRVLGRADVGLPAGDPVSLPALQVTTIELPASVVGIEREGGAKVVVMTFHATGNFAEYQLDHPDPDLTTPLGWTQHYTYDAKGNLTQTATYEADGALAWTQRYTYDARGNLTEEATYEADGTLNSKTGYTYDAKGKQTEAAFYKAGGVLEQKWRYSYEAYDAAGNWIMRTGAKVGHQGGQILL